MPPLAQTQRDWHNHISSSASTRSSWVMRAPSDAGSAKAGLAAARFTRPLVAATVVLLSAATGYAASRLWPLPTSSGLVMNLAITGTGSAPESQSGPQLNYRAPAPGPRMSTSVAKTVSSASSDVLSQPTPAVAPHVSETARIEAGGAAHTPGAREAAPAETPQAHADTPDKPTTRRETRRRAVAARRVAGARVSRTVRRQKTAGSESAVAEFAPNPRPNQPLRDFMASRAARN